jgi:hypothetical protein
MNAQILLQVQRHEGQREIEPDDRCALGNTNGEKEAAKTLPSLVGRNRTQHNRSQA